MKKGLEKFIQENREDFDKFEPGPVVWHNIQQQLAKTPEKKGVYVSMRVLRWSAAAAIVIALGVGAFIFVNNNTGEKMVAENPVKKSSESFSSGTNNLPDVDTANTLAANISEGQKTTAKTSLPYPGIDKQNNQPRKQLKNHSDFQVDKELLAYEQSTHYFARLIVNKQNELKVLEKTNPRLYKEFVNDINDLDVSYKGLKKQLPQTEDRSRLIKAMIKTLQLQIELLNNQLIIVNKIESKQKITNAGLPTRTT
jgi:hypothetical protein